MYFQTINELLMHEHNALLLIMTVMNSGMNDLFFLLQNLCEDNRHVPKPVLHANESCWFSYNINL